MSILKSIFLWVITVIIFIAIAYYQRVTGPTKPVRGKVEIKGKEYRYEFIRTYDGDKAPVKLEIENNQFKGIVKHHVYRSKGEWTIVTMEPEKENIVAYLPHMPPAGKVEYNVFLSDGNKEYLVNKEPIVLRYKGVVPSFVLIPHVIFMILAILFSLRAGVEIAFKGRKTFTFATVTVVTLFLGGLVLGPIVQKYAFGDYWTGWPYGSDWTDNKTIIAFIFWVIAWIVLKKNKENKFWVVIAVIALLATYLIPHSMGGSELDAESGKVTTGLKE